jgi:hypothetical protein
VFQGKCLKLLEKQNLELLEIKAFLTNLKQGPQGGTAPDFSSIPSLPLRDEAALRQFETWLNLEANRSLLV